MSTHKKIPHHLFPLNIQTLFFKTFSVRVPQIALRSLPELRERGIHSVREDDVENVRYHQDEVHTSLSVNRLVEIWNNGYEITVERTIDCAEIFEAVTMHLQQWVGYLSSGIQVAEAPFEELLLLDRFADKVYVHSRHERVSRNLDYFTNQIRAYNLGFNLNPMTQGGERRIYNPLSGSSDGGLFIDPKQSAKEERQSFEGELSRLGGRLSRSMQASERASIFDHIQKDAK